MGNSLVLSGNAAAVDWTPILSQARGETCDGYVLRSVDTYKKLVFEAVQKVGTAPEGKRTKEMARQVRRLVPDARDATLSCQLDCALRVADDMSEFSKRVAAVIDTYVRNHVVNGFAKEKVKSYAMQAASNPEVSLDALLSGCADVEAEVEEEELRAEFERAMNRLRCGLCNGFGHEQDKCVLLAEQDGADKLRLGEDVVRRLADCREEDGDGRTRIVEAKIGESRRVTVLHFVHK